MDSPDLQGTVWPAWLQCEENPLYDDLHPDPPENLNRGHWGREALKDRNPGPFMHRTWNQYRVARRFCPGILSYAGYYLLNDSDGAVLDEDGFPVERERPGCQDYYFFAYARDYKQALRDFRRLSGPAPIPTHRSFGLIISRWPAFTEEEVVSMAETFRKEGYPLATLVMDMEWHTEGWGTWDFNPEMIPDPERFFALCRSYGLEVTFNDHPLDVHENDSHYADYVAAAGPEVEIRERTYNDKQLNMARVDICDKQQNEAFRKVCHAPFMELGLDYWWNDGSRGEMRQTAGHLVDNEQGTKIIPPAIYLRWLQFGVFNSILRFHCAPGSGSRLPYDCEGDVHGACAKWLPIIPRPL